MLLIIGDNLDYDNCQYFYFIEYFEFINDFLLSDIVNIYKTHDILKKGNLNFYK